MVDRDEASHAADALTMVLAGLAEAALELVASPRPSRAEEAAANFRRLAELGQDMALAASTAAMILERVSESLERS